MFQPPCRSIRARPPRLGMRALFALALLGLAGSFPGSAARAQETSVPLDSLGRVTSIDTALENKLHLFRDSSGFREARLFQLADSTFLLEISRQVQGRLVRDRLPRTPAEVSALRRLVSARIGSLAPGAVLDRSGRAKLLIGSAVLSVFYYGWACPVAFRVSKGSEVGGLYLLTSGGTMLATILLTRNREVSDASGTLGLYGATRGIVHGVLLSELLTGADASARTTITAGWLASMGEGVLGFHLAGRGHLSKGHAEMIGAAGDWGIFLSLEEAGLSRSDGLTTSGLVLGGAGLGMTAGHLLGRSGAYTRGDAYLFRASGILGTLLGVTAASAFDPDEDRAYAAASLAGGLAGLAWGAHQGRATRFTGGEGVLLHVGEIGGALIGEGAVVLVNPLNDHPFPYLLGASLGALACFGLTYHMIAPGNDLDETSDRWSLELTPGFRGVDQPRAAARPVVRDRPWSLSLGYRFQ